MKPRSPGKAGNGYSLALLQQIHLESACLSILISCLARRIFCTFIVTVVIFRGLQRLRLFVRQRPEFHPTVREFSSIFQLGSPSRDPPVWSEAPEIRLRAALPAGLIRWPSRCLSVLTCAPGGFATLRLSGYEKRMREWICRAGPENVQAPLVLSPCNSDNSRHLGPGSASWLCGRHSLLAPIRLLSIRRQ